ncbi:nuclear transport factor 2 family protein [Pontibacter sp. KCTC 32443]|uniref:nuclear transport factor 2 family protein n=1 Tax=Pontibacter TaxID=323449 RepID=UPI00164ECB3F|nr:MULTISPECIES: nuclear transport factor 2 family protein [Pontibacter]MBC5773583.1 nuclear transport factor 2 family protein [Pontibacter sp. KCTC 32443]
MKNLFPALLILAGTTLSCQQQTNTATEVPETATIATESTDAAAVKVMHQMFEAFNSHDLAAMQTLYADSVVFMSPEMEKPVVGAHHVKTIYGPLFEMAPNVKDEVKHYIHSNGEVAVEFVSTGTIENISPDDPAQMKGKTFELKIFARLKVKDGKIIEDVSYFDQMAFLKQVGLME